MPRIEDAIVAALPIGLALVVLGWICERASLTIVGGAMTVPFVVVSAVALIARRARPGDVWRSPDG